MIRIIVLSVFAFSAALSSCMEPENLSLKKRGKRRFSKRLVQGGTIDGSRRKRRKISDKKCMQPIGTKNIITGWGYKVVRHSLRCTYSGCPCLFSGDHGEAEVEERYFKHEKEMHSLNKKTEDVEAYSNTVQSQETKKFMLLCTLGECNKIYRSVSRTNLWRSIENHAKSKYHNLLEKDWSEFKRTLVIEEVGDKIQN